MLNNKQDEKQKAQQYGDRGMNLKWPYEMQKLGNVGKMLFLSKLVFLNL